MQRPASVILMAAMVSACSSASSPSLVSQGSAGLLSTSAAARAIPQHLDRRNSWFSSDLNKAAQVLFVSDSGTGDVYLYKLPTLKRIGTITGFDQPQGECSDTSGDVWITDTNATTIYELSHEGSLKNRLSDPSGYPDGCAWDPTTGNLAVMNLFGLNSTAGAVLIYPGSSGSPKAYTNPQQYYYNFGDYDVKGDLFFDGRDDNGVFMLSEISKDAGSAHTVGVAGGTIYFPGMVQWSPSYLNVGDQDCGNAYASCIYRLSVTSKTGKIVGRTTLKREGGGAVCDLVQGVIRSGQIVGSDYEFCGYSTSSTYRWAYPRGGKPSASNDSVDSTPVGAAISRK